MSKKDQPTAVESIPEVTELQTPVQPIFGFKRDENGLILGREYPVDDAGYIDWRALVNPDHLYPNKDAFRDKPVPESIEGLEDHQLLIKLGGIKELARLRGFKSVAHDVKVLNEGHVVDTCTVEWIGNYETGGEPVVFQDVANATYENCSGFGAKFLETIAANRAFVRAVRNFLNIHIVGADEIDKSKSPVVEVETGEVVSTPSIHGALKKLAAKKGIQDWPAMLDFLREAYRKESYRNEDTKNWSDFKDIPAIECRKIMVVLKES